MCPLGFMFALVDKLRGKLGFVLHPRSDCASCKSHEGCSTCSKACPEDIAVFENGANVPESCTMCLDCVENCPTKAISLSLKRAEESCGTPEESSK